MIIFVYSVDNYKSFESLKTYWYQEVKSNSLSNVIIGVVGNKNDLYNIAQIKESEAIEWADSIGAIFQLTSAKSNSGIDLLFTNLVKKYLNPDFDYKKDDEEAKKIYEQKKKEQEENKRRKTDKEDDDAVKLPQVDTIKLRKDKHGGGGGNNEQKKKGGCC